MVLCTIELLQQLPVDHEEQAAMTLEPFPSSVEDLWEWEKNLLLREVEQVRGLTSSSLNLTMALWLGPSSWLRPLLPKER